MKITNSTELGNAIKVRRKKLGHTQKDVAEFLGYSASFLSDLENGKKTIELEKTIKVAASLGIDILLEER